MQFFGIKNEYLDCYCEYSFPPTQGTPMFHIATGLAILSALTNRKYFLQMGHSEIYTNLWLVLVGQSTIRRKSVIMRTGEKKLREIWQMTGKTDKPFIFPNEFSPERFAQILNESKSGLLTWGELMKAINIFEGRSYMAGFIDTLTDLYDVIPVYDRQIMANKNIYVERPCFSIIAGTTPGKFQGSIINRAKFEAGFSQRFFYINEDKNAPVVWEHITPSGEAGKLLNTFLLNTYSNAKITGSVDVPQEIKMIPTLQKKYKKWVESLNLYSEDTDLVAFKGRIATGVLKISMLLALSKGNITIIETDLDDAIIICRHFLDVLPELFNIAFNQFEADRINILKVLSSYLGEWAPYDEILREFNTYAFNCERALETLIQRREIERKRISGVSCYRKITS